MLESRWFRRAGPGSAAVIAIAIVASSTAGARATTWQPTPCTGPPRVGPAGNAIGTWYRLDPTIVDGVEVGQRLTLGASAAAGSRVLDLPPESFAAGPFGGTLLVGSDDGTVSRRALIDVASGCAWSLGRSSEVVRRATLTPDGSALIEFRVDRRTRADLGVWRRPLTADRGEERVLPPIEPDGRFGPTWLTELSWSDDGALLAVQSCGEVACRVRWLELATGATGRIADPTLGEMVGLTRDRLVARAACRGLPCPIRDVSLRTGDMHTLVRSAGQALLGRGLHARSEVLYESEATGGSLRAIGVDGTADRLISGALGGRRLIAGPYWAGGRITLPAGWLALGVDGRLPLDGPAGFTFRRIDDGRRVVLPEVSR
jgi:hypothetical protein